MGYVNVDGDTVTGLLTIGGYVPMSAQMAEAGAIWLGPFDDDDEMDALAIIPGHICAVTVDTVGVTVGGTRHRRMLAEVATPEGHFSFPVDNPDGLLDTDVEITVRRVDQ